MKFFVFIFLLFNLGCRAQVTHVKEAFKYHHYGIHDTTVIVNNGGFLTADEYVPPYTDGFHLGNNPGYYPEDIKPSVSFWSDDDLAHLMTLTGFNSSRLKLTDQFVWPGTNSFYNIRFNSFTNYVTIDSFQDIICITGEQPAGVPKGQTTLADGSGPNGHIDTAHYYPCPIAKKVIAPGDTLTYADTINWHHSSLFANLYQPIWDTAQDGTLTPHPTNWCAVYYANLCQTYPMIKFWEVVNEPDFTGLSSASPWLYRMPKGNEVSNAWVPQYIYIRELRVAYTVIKHYLPNAYVCPGGMGYFPFFDALCRYTDNPGTTGADSAGTVNANYPKKGSAYFDAICYHVYPYYTQHYVSSLGKFQAFVYSDSCANEMGKYHDDFWNTAIKYGYDGIHKPKKIILQSETNVSARRTVNVWGSDSLQIAFAMKAFVRGQKKGDATVTFFTTGDHWQPIRSDSIIPANKEYNYMGAWHDLQLYDQAHTLNAADTGMHNEGIAIRTCAKLLLGHGWGYDSVATLAAGFTGYLMPGQAPGMANITIDGCVFTNIGHGNQRYMIWARTGGVYYANLCSEAPIDPNAKYTFPASFHHVWRYEWNWAADWFGGTFPAPAYVSTAGGVPVGPIPSIFEYAD